ncbi:MAG: 30S ribosomal protein S10 [Candidatus Micrarchaeia archaeon]
MGKVRIKLLGRDRKELDELCRQIVEIAKAGGVRVSGPIPLPTKKLIIPTRRTPCGDGSDTYERWVMKIHKRLIEIEGDEKTMRQIVRVKVPDTVQIEVTIS